MKGVEERMRGGEGERMRGGEKERRRKGEEERRGGVLGHAGSGNTPADLPNFSQDGMLRN